MNKATVCLTLILVLLFSPFVSAKTDLQSYFIQVTEATQALEQGDSSQAHQKLEALESSFGKESQASSPAGQATQLAIEAAKADLSHDKLVAISRSLLAFDKEQNPVDESAAKDKLEKRLTPLIKQLESATAKQDIESVKLAYKQVNSGWTANESIVRSTSSAHYNRIETSLALLRAAIELEPVDYQIIEVNSQSLKQAIQDFLTGTELESATGTNLASLKDGLQLLEKAKEAFAKGQTSQAKETMKSFIELWPSIEGEVSTRNYKLYTRVEQETPVIMVKGQDPTYQTKLESLIDELKQINKASQYSYWDVTLIVLREGLEAMLIVLALVASLRSLKAKRPLAYVYAGTGTGLLASIALALALTALLPTIFSGVARELIEAVTGFFAVVTLTLVGIWLHRSSSLASWQAYIDRQLAAYQRTGRLWTLFGVSFLAVFREGAETILFLVGILSKISFWEMLLGISLATLILALVWLVLKYLANRLSLPWLFKILTIGIYVLAFKILGVSIHTLIVTQYLPANPIVWGNLQAIEWLGFYPTWWTVASQALYLLGLVFVFFLVSRGEKTDG
ncbi:FTR1 family protein [uncultured Abiotrophia sp.]|uniref:FTR1 family iron permease n=1 Tax=uncultured Abiotrophia sp. TaxID=316094 RepID=UPI002613BB2A|nr:FTR1 family protein [uncultured Abiotrophia sp.]